MFDMNDQREFANPSRCITAWALREAFANVRVEHECISRRQRAHAKSVRRSTRFAHCPELNEGGSGLRCREIVLVEFDQTGDVLHKFGRQLLFAKDAGGNRGCDRRLKVCRRVSLPYFPRRVLMESMHKIVELKRINFATIPSIELRAKLAEGVAQVAIVSDPRPFSDEAFDLFRNFLHRFVWLTSRRSPAGAQDRIGGRLVQRVLGRRLTELVNSSSVP
jgi:hypothetical protein